MPSVIFISDPLCSWCWGMATQIAQIRRDLADDFDFDLLLGGINVASTRPFSDAGRARLVQLWRTVAQVTSASFGDGPPFGDFVYNSTQACIATEAMREATGQPPFEFLERLQRSFFTDARDITRRESATVLPPPSRTIQLRCQAWCWKWTVRVV